jgi:hypothetical protein
MKRVITGILAIAGLWTVTANGDTTHHLKQMRESITVSEPVVAQVDQYLTVNLDRSNSCLSKTGEPMVPVIRKVFILPPGSKVDRVDVSFSPAQETVLSRQLLPGPAPVPKTGGAVYTKREKRNDIYESSAVYPPETFNYSTGAGIKDGNRVVILTVDCYPVRYSPASNLLHCSQGIDITVTCSAGSLQVHSRLFRL